MYPRRKAHLIALGYPRQQSLLLTDRSWEIRDATFSQTPSSLRVYKKPNGTLFRYSARFTVLCFVSKSLLLPREGDLFIYDEVRF